LIVGVLEYGSAMLCDGPPARKSKKRRLYPMTQGVLEKAVAAATTIETPTK
jgi:hypothetical protein